MGIFLWYAFDRLLDVTLCRLAPGLINGVRYGCTDLPQGFCGDDPEKHG